MSRPTLHFAQNIYLGVIRIALETNLKYIYTRKKDNLATVYKTNLKKICQLTLTRNFRSTVDPDDDGEGRSFVFVLFA